MMRQPFSAVNNLERLLQLGQYRRYISVDEILSVILGDWSNVMRLDARLARIPNAWTRCASSISVRR